MRIRNSKKDWREDGWENSVSLFLLSLAPSSAPIPPVQGFPVTQHSWEPYRTGGVDGTQELLSPDQCFLQSKPLSWLEMKGLQLPRCHWLPAAPKVTSWKTELCTFLTHQVSQGTSLCYYPLFCQGCWQWVNNTNPLCSSSKSSDKTWKMLLRNKTMPSAHHNCYLL